MQCTEKGIERDVYKRQEDIRAELKVKDINEIFKFVEDNGGIICKG